MVALAQHLKDSEFKAADLLDLVALGTVADMVPLDKNNRVLVAQGLRRIRAGVPIILSSGFSEQEVVGRFAGQGLAGFLKKPYEPSELTEALHRALAQRVVG